MRRVYEGERRRRLERPPDLRPEQGEGEAVAAQQPEDEAAAEPGAPAQRQTGHGRTRDAPFPPDLEQVDPVGPSVVPDLLAEPREVAPGGGAVARPRGAGVVSGGGVRGGRGGAVRRADGVGVGSGAGGAGGGGGWIWVGGGASGRT